MTARSHIAWITDPHLNFIALAPGTPIQALGRALRDENPRAQTLLITGDISEGPYLRDHLKAIKEGWGRDIWFCLGNHDYWKVGWDEAERLCKGIPGTIQLGVPGGDWIQIPGNGIALVGQAGWCDARLSRSQAAAIGETKACGPFPYHPDGLVIENMLARAQAQAKQAKTAILAAYLHGNRSVVLATHFPPYRLASWHQGAPSEDAWLGLMTSGSMGGMIDQLVESFLDLQVTVLCGHTHSKGEYHRGDRIKVLTGGACYGAPDVVPGCGDMDFQSLFTPGRIMLGWDFASEPSVGA